jgi:hypothetical protein
MHKHIEVPAAIYELALGNKYRRPIEHYRALIEPAPYVRLARQINHLAVEMFVVRQNQPRDTVQFTFSRGIALLATALFAN